MAAGLDVLKRLFAVRGVVWAPFVSAAAVGKLDGFYAYVHVHERRAADRRAGP